LKVLEYNWEEDCVVGWDVKLQCSCGHVFVVRSLTPEDVIVCPSCNRRFEYLGCRTEFIFREEGEAVE